MVSLPLAPSLSGVFVKICGITREEDALLAVAMGADAVGFVFAPSKRQIAPSVAGDIIKRLPPEILTVGVFRDEAPARVVEIVNTTGLRAAQLHGHETAEGSTWVRERVPFVIKAFSAGSPELTRASSYRADAVLIDSPRPGSGQVFDWALAQGQPLNIRTILAGGLNPQNVGAAIRQVRPWGVDVATGVESSKGEPGLKDALKVQAFIAAARAAEATYRSSADDVDLQRDVPFDWMQDGTL